MPVRKMTRIALLSAILYIAKVVLEFIPNVELISFLTIIYTLVFGTEALLIVTVFNMFELVQWGFGVWWISYLYVWPLLVLATIFIKKDACNGRIWQGGVCAMGCGIRQLRSVVWFPVRNCLFAG